MFHDCLGSSYPALQQPWCRCCHSRCRCGWWCVELWTFPDPLWSGWWCGTSWLLLPRSAPADTHTLTKSSVTTLCLFVPCSIFHSFIRLFFCWPSLLFIHATRPLVRLSSCKLMTITRSHSLMRFHEIHVWHDTSHEGGTTDVTWSPGALTQISWYRLKWSLQFLIVYFISVSFNSSGIT